jgi:hypothetical protein
LRGREEKKSGRKDRVCIFEKDRNTGTVSARQA